MTSRRGANMSPFEDEALCRAYVIVSLDSIQGANQIGDQLWESVAAKYHEQPNIVLPRTPCSLQSRYHTISSSVQYFMSKLSHAISTQASGTNDVDVVNQARDAYVAEKKKQFPFDKCLSILKDHPKFDMNNTCSNTQRSRFGLGDSEGTSVNMGEDFDSTDVEFSPSNKPMDRRNQAKLQQKRKEKEKSMTVENEYLKKAEEFSEMIRKSILNNETTQLSIKDQMTQLLAMKDVERLRNDREEARREREEKRRVEEYELRKREVEVSEEVALMALDLSKMSDQQRQLYNYCIDDLLRRKHEARQSSQNYQWR